MKMLNSFAVADETGYQICKYSVPNLKYQFSFKHFFADPLLVRGWITEIPIFNTGKAFVPLLFNGIKVSAYTIEKRANIRTIRRGYLLGVELWWSPPLPSPRLTAHPLTYGLAINWQYHCHSLDVSSVGKDKKERSEDLI